MKICIHMYYVHIIIHVGHGWRNRDELKSDVLL